MKIESVKTAQLIPYIRKAKAHPENQVEKIARSILEFGFLVPVLIDDNSFEIIAGQGRLLGAKRIGMDQVPAIRIKHLSPEQIRAFRIADNKVAESEWLREDLKLEMIELQAAGLDLAILGFEDVEINQLLYLDAKGNPGKTDPDQVPLASLKPVSKPGDVWICGRHRVMCGSSTRPNDLSILLDGDLADMVFTDPPYLMNFVGSPPKNRGEGSGPRPLNASHGPILNDKLSKEKGDEFLRSVCRAIKIYCRGAYYICFYRLGIDRLLEAMKAAGLRWRSQIIWRKNHFNLSNSDYKSLYEPIILGWADEYQPIFYGWNMGHEWYGHKNEKDVWEIELPSIWEVDRTIKNDLHPTMKPAELVERAVLNSSRPGGSVLDMFSGSGTTLIACERRDRTCYAMELDPKYCDVTVRRWEEFTGRIAELKPGTP